MIIFSSSISFAMASDSSVGASSAAIAPSQEVWYPEFAADYESGACTTSPSPALLAFAAGADSSSGDSTLGRKDKESCCERWFPEQELCGCLGGCPEEKFDAPTASLTPEPLSEDWYPQFDVSYEEGKCVKIGVNTDEAPPTYFTKEHGFLHASLDSCCERWFQDQRTKTCMNVLVDQPVDPMANMNATAVVVELAAGDPPVVSIPFAIATEETR